MRVLLCTAFMAAFLASQSALADLAITEAANTSGASGVLSGFDWWELTNTGPGSVLLDGYEWEDNNPSFDTAVFPNGITVAAGESIIIHEDGGNVGIADAFRTAWGLPNSVQVLVESQFGGANTFSGLSSGGDEINLYDNSLSLAAMVSFGAAVSGVSYEWAKNGTDLGLSVNGENGAYLSTDNAVGSPGYAVPEPSTMALVSLALCALTGRGLRRRK